jgi:hypothetical protein
MATAFISLTMLADTNSPGANQALEDAVVLAQALRQADFRYTEAFEAFYQRRYRC